MSDEFLSQLEQRTQQVKITLANLEAEKVRIEAQIAQLQPIVPHYDALLSAERQLADAAIDLEPAQPEPETPSESSGWSSDAPGERSSSRTPDGAGAGTAGASSSPRNFLDAPGSRLTTAAELKLRGYVASGAAPRCVR